MRQAVRSIARAWAAASIVGWAVFVAFVLGTVSNAHAAEPQPMTDLPAPRLEQRRETPQTTVDAISKTVMCPSCDTTLDGSDSPAAQRMRVWVTAAVEAGWTDAEIRDGLVAEYDGDESVLATPRARGAGIIVWLVPALVALAALAAGVTSLRRWRREAAARQTRSASPGSHASGSTRAHSESMSSSSGSASSGPSSAR